VPSVLTCSWHLKWGQSYRGLCPKLVEMIIIGPDLIRWSVKSGGALSGKTVGSIRLQQEGHSSLLVLKMEGAMWQSLGDISQWTATKEMGISFLQTQKLNSVTPCELRSWAWAQNENLTSTLISDLWNSELRIKPCHALNPNLQNYEPINRFCFKPLTLDQMLRSK
jgi:hypothetical protein